MRHLAPTTVFSKFVFHCHFPFYPRSISPPSWSLHHCHSHTNFPAIAASPCTTFLTANLCRGRTHPSSGSLRSAPSPPAPRCAHSRTCSAGLSWLHLNPSNQVLVCWGRTGTRNQPLPVCPAKTWFIVKMLFLMSRMWQAESYIDSPLTINLTR